MKIIVAGSRSFNDWNLLKDTLARLTRKLKRVEVISGHAAGADRLGERWATEEAPKLFGYGNARLTVFHADWDKHGKAAGPIRNTEMVEYVGEGGAAVFFHVGDSKGTADCIAKARRAGLKVKVVQYDEDW